MEAMTISQLVLLAAADMVAPTKVASMKVARRAPMPKVITPV